MFDELFAYLLNLGTQINVLMLCLRKKDTTYCGTTECCAIMKLSFKQSRFASKKLDQLANSHTRRKTVRIYYHVRTDARLGEWKIFLFYNQS